MSPRALALTGGVWGVVGTAGLLGLELRDDPEFLFEPLGWLAGAFGLLAPYLLALAVAGVRQPVRAGAWMGSGLAGLALSATALSISTIVLLPAGFLLLIGGAMDLGPPRLGWLSALFAVAVVAVAIGGLFARSLTVDVRCWKLVQTPSGQEWRAAEPETGPGVGLTLQGDEVEGRCSSDVVSGTEAAFVFGVWGTLGAAVVIAGRSRRPVVPAEGPA